MKAKIFHKTILAAFLALATTSFVIADQRGQEIVRKVDDLERSDTASMILEMSVYPASGGSPRVFSIRSLEKDDPADSSGDDTSFVEFVEPRSVRGLRILSKGSDSWVFFPSTGRVRKIAGSSRTGSVQGVGGDFSYDDLGGGAWSDDYEFVVIREDNREWEVEGTRKDADSAYDSVKIVIDKSIGLATLASFASKKEGGYYKELSLSDFKVYSGKKRASRMVMKNLKKGSSTEVILKEAIFDLPLEDRYFDPARFDK